MKAGIVRLYWMKVAFIANPGLIANGEAPTGMRSGPRRAYGG